MTSRARIVTILDNSKSVPAVDVDIALPSPDAC